MSAQEIASDEREQYQSLRFLADFLTLFRLATAVFIVCLGLFVGPAALKAAIVAVFVGLLTDTFDGALARSSGTPPSWVATVDIPADLALVFSFFLFLVITGLYPVVPALILVVFAAIIVLIRPTYSVVQMVSAPFSALPIVLSFYAGWLVGATYMTFLAALVFLRWDRLAGYAGEARKETEHGD